MTPREEQEYAAEILRMVERYKAGESSRRVPMVEADKLPGQPAGNQFAIPTTPFGGPDADEYAYLGTPSPPVQHAESMMPQGSLSPRKIWPGSLEAGRRLGAVGGRRTADRPIPLPVPGQDFSLANLPPGYSVDETNTVRDPDGNVPRTKTPSAGDMASYLAYAASPQGVPAAALKAVAGAARTGAEATRGNRPEEETDYSRARATQLLQMMQDYMRGPQPPERPVALGVRG